MSNPKANGGFTLIETVLVLGLIGAMMLFTLPNIMNSLETRNLDNSARQVQATLQQARFRAVKEKAEYRIRFALVKGVWQVLLETSVTTGVWTPAPGFVPILVSPKVVLTVNLPAPYAVEFSPVGIVQGYSGTQNTLTLQSLKLKAKLRQDLRILTVFQGGSVQYQRASS